MVHVTFLSAVVDELITIFAITETCDFVNYFKEVACGKFIIFVVYSFRTQKCKHLECSSLKVLAFSAIDILDS